MRRLPYVVALLLFCMAKTTGAATYYVPDDFGTIQEAIDGQGIVADDTIIVRDGTYYEDISFTNQVLTVRSENGAATTIIDGSGSGTVVYFEYDAVLEVFTITNGGRGIDFGDHLW